MPGLVVGSSSAYVGEGWIGDGSSGDGTTVIQADLNAAGVGAAAFVGSTQATTVLSAVGTGATNFESDTGTTIIEADFNAPGSCTVAFVGSSPTTTVLAAAGVGATSFESSVVAQVVLASSGVGLFDAQGMDSGVSGTPVLADFNADGVGSAAFIGSSPTETVFNSSGIGAAEFVSGVVAEVSFSMVGAAFVILMARDGNAPEGPAINNFVPIRYVLGETANVVPVETVLVSEIGVVPCRVLVGPANVVPVREAAVEMPRVKVRIV